MSSVTAGVRNRPRPKTVIVKEDDDDDVNFCYTLVILKCLAATLLFRTYCVASPQETNALGRCLAYFVVHVCGQTAGSSVLSVYKGNVCIRIVYRSSREEWKVTWEWCTERVWAYVLNSSKWIVTTGTAVCEQVRTVTRLLYTVLIVIYIVKFVYT